MCPALFAGVKYACNINILRVGRCVRHSSSTPSEDERWRAKPNGDPPAGRGCPADIREALKRQAAAAETTPFAIVRGLLAAHVAQARARLLHSPILPEAAQHPANCRAEEEKRGRRDDKKRERAVHLILQDADERRRLVRQGAEVDRGERLASGCAPFDLNERVAGICVAGRHATSDFRTAEMQV